MERGRDGRTPTVFVTDVAVDAIAVSEKLRAAGYAVIDVPLAMLVARAQGQPPHVVLLDIDAGGALEEVARLRKLPGSGAIDFIYFGTGEGPVKNADDAFANDGSAFFVRPVDIAALVRRIEALTGGGAYSGRNSRSSPPPPSPPVARLEPSSSPPSRPSLPSPGARTPGPPLPMSSPSLVDLVDPPRSLATFGAISSELQQLLVEAELRAQVQSTPEVPMPSPEEEIEAVLPADVLASLDEPLEYEDEEHQSEPQTGSGVVQEQVTGAITKSTTAGGSKQPTTGSARTSPPHAGERPASSEVPPPAPPPDDSTERRPIEIPSDVPSVSLRIDPVVAPAPPAPLKEGVVLGPGDARRFFASAIAGRRSGALCFESGRVVRRIVLRDGDLVTAASGDERESLVHFLGARGELPRDDVERLAAKVPPYGRHAGAALVAHGWLRQDQLWSVLRAHSEWIAAKALALREGIAQLEAEPPGRLRAEPSVFGASTGAEIFVELVRRTVSPEDAVSELGGPASRVVDGANQALLSECALPAQDIELLTRARGSVLRDLLTRAGGAEIACVLHALVLLRVMDVVPAPDFQRPRGKAAPEPADVALDEEAVRARVRARIEVVDEGDYFAVLGVTRDATGYEVRRAFVELRRNFEPSRILTPRLVDLTDDVRKIVVVIEEAYEILRDAARRERYRRAIEARPD